MWRDLRYAVQGLWRSPIFTLAATLALGLAIGANATIFGLVDGLWFRPPGVAKPGQIAWIFSTTPTEKYGFWSYPEYLALRDRTRSFSGVIALGPRGAIMPAADGTPELLLVNVVSENFFTTLGIKPAFGRLFAPGDEAALEAQPGVVLGHAFWLRRFGGDPSVVGTTLRLLRGTPLPVTVLGVLPETFRAMEASADRDLWMPPQTWVRLANRREFENRDQRWFEVIARRQPSVSVAGAGAEVVTLVRALAAEYADTNAGRSARVLSDFGYRYENGGASAMMLLGLVLLVVLITCVNVANLLLARGVSRTRELAVRVALGATRRRVIRQLMTESAMLGLLGAFAGLTIALWLIRLLPAIIGEPPGFHSFMLFQADTRVLVFTLATTLLTTVLFGIAPSWLAARSDVVALIKGASGPLGGSRDRVLRQALMMTQIAVSLMLLCGAAVLTRSFIETQRADLGVTRKPLLTAWVVGADITPSQAASTREALRRLEALPGVTRAAVALRAPLSLSGGGYARPLYFPDHPPEQGAGLPEVKMNTVSAAYFDTVGTRLLRGRLFDAADDRPAGEPVMIVNEQFARRFFPGTDAVGSRVRLGGPSGPEHRIIGVVQNAVINAIDEPPEPYFYVPYWRAKYGEATFLVQTSGDAAALAPAVRDALRTTDPKLDPRRLITMQQYIDYSASKYRATATLAMSLAGLGLVLTMLGVYGVMAYRTTRRTREFGIRIALGAERGQVLRLVLVEAMRVAALGLAIGIPAALAGTRLIESLLFNVGARDVPAFTVASILVLVGVCLSAAIPAWRATRVSPSTALRDA